MTGTTGPVALTLPGSFTDLELDTAAADDLCHFKATDHGQVAESTLIIGSTYDGTQVKLKSEDPGALRKLARLLDRCASFQEDAQRNGLAA